MLSAYPVKSRETIPLLTVEFVLIYNIPGKKKLNIRARLALMTNPLGQRLPSCTLAKTH